MLAQLIWLWCVLAIARTHLLDHSQATLMRQARQAGSPRSRVAARARAACVLSSLDIQQHLQQVLPSRDRQRPAAAKSSIQIRHPDSA